jgi:hypothetical protein
MVQAATVAWRKWLLLKLPILELLERWFDPSDPDVLRERYDEAIAALDSPDPSDWLAVARKAGLDDDDAEHFTEHWLGEDEDQYWSSIPQDVTMSRIRAGFRDAMISARDAGVPINYAWASLDGLAKDFFEVAHVAGPNGVVAMIITATPDFAGLPD